MVAVESYVKNHYGRTGPSLSKRNDLQSAQKLRVPLLPTDIELGVYRKLCIYILHNFASGFARVLVEYYPSGIKNSLYAIQEYDISVPNVIRI